MTKTAGNKIDYPIFPVPVLGFRRPTQTTLRKAKRRPTQINMAAQILLFGARRAYFAILYQLFIRAIFGCFAPLLLFLWRPSTLAPYAAA